MNKRERRAVAARSAERYNYCNLVRAVEDLDALFYYLSDCDEVWIEDIAFEAFTFKQGWKQFRKAATGLLKVWGASVERRIKDGQLQG